jgi:anti-sigma regulatory factor (Ser/Thr protein kinase)/serine/threonine protein phosphatase PrpC
MGATLVAHWMAGLDPVSVHDEASVTLVRQRVREVAAESGLSPVAAEQMATAASELAHNQLRHARHGEIDARAIEREGTRGIELVAADGGPGIGEVARALRGEGGSATHLGVGVASVLGFSDEMDLDVRLGEGTCVRARKLAGSAPWRTDCAVLGRPHRGELESGDAALVVREGEAILACVVDGLGHGAAAAEAARAAIVSVRADMARSLVDIVERCDESLAGTRGAVASVMRLDLRTRALEHAGAGNVTTRIFSRGGSRTMHVAARTLGLPSRAPRRITLERATLEPGELLAMFTDGIASRAELPDALLREHPGFAAAHLCEQHGRDNDDALVVVIR